MRGLGLLAALFRISVGRARPPAWLALAGLTAGAFVASGCLYSATPVSDVNPAGTSHTITARVGPPRFTEQQIIDVIEQFIGGPIESILSAPHFERDFGAAVVFEVKTGPNAGRHSTTDCQPTCFFNSEVESNVAWTYTSDGRVGTDRIRVCAIEAFINSRQVALGQDPSQNVDEFLSVIQSDVSFLASQLGLTVPEFLQVINVGLGTHFTDVEDIFCDWVTKEWKNPNVSGLAGVFAPLAQQAQENRERANAATGAPAAAQVSPPSTGQGARIVPPSTGDAGLADGDGTAWLWLTFGGSVVTLGGSALLRRVVTRR